jgi:hypothetical protein
MAPKAVMVFLDLLRTAMLIIVRLTSVPLAGGEMPTITVFMTLGKMLGHGSCFGFANHWEQSFATSSF